jgi:O-acetyl-ADP-ribose deacetylase (regulator of RNase III)
MRADADALIGHVDTVTLMARVEVLDTDIMPFDVDAIANAANTRLLHGGGVAGAISREEGARIEVEEVRRHLDEGSGLERVVFAVRGDAAHRAFEATLD